jgi:pimeloyl-ACP methyl ester carboxylesterase
MAAGPPEHIYGLGIKSVWAEDELAGMHRLAQKPQKLYPDAESARQWYLKVAGIAGMAPTGMDCGARAIVEAPAGQWRLAQDPRVYDIASPDLPSLTANLQGRFSLVYGAEDSMVDVADLARIDPAVARLEGGGHNIMVNRPEAVWAWLS